MKRTALLLALAASMLAATPSAFAEITYYRATISGPSEAPPNPSPGAGIASIIIDDVAHTMQLNVPFIDLLGTTTAAHIHCCTVDPLAGTAMVATTLPTFPDFPGGVQSGLYTRTLDLTDPASYNPAFITAFGGTAATAETALLNGINLNQSYLNIHTTEYPGGEIRGFLVQSPIPEPASWAMLGVGLAGIAFSLRKRA